SSFLPLSRKLSMSDCIAGSMFFSPPSAKESQYSAWKSDMLPKNSLPSEPNDESKLLPLSRYNDSSVGLCRPLFSLTLDNSRLISLSERISSQNSCDGLMRKKLTSIEPT